MTSMDAPRGDESLAPARDPAPGNTSSNAPALAPDASDDHAGDAHADASVPDVEAGARRSIKAPALADVQLGEETFVKWYMEYPKIYSYRRLAELPLKAVDENLARVPGRPLHANPGTNHL